MKKRFLAALLCLCLLVGLVPGMGTTAFAASQHNIGDTVWFAGHVWYIIGTESEGVTAPAGCYTLFAKNNDFGETQFDSTNDGLYRNSTLQKKWRKLQTGFPLRIKQISLPAPRLAALQAVIRVTSSCGRLAGTS